MLLAVQLACPTLATYVGHSHIRHHPPTLDKAIFSMLIRTGSFTNRYPRILPARSSLACIPVLCMHTQS